MPNSNLDIVGRRSRGTALLAIGIAMLISLWLYLGPVSSAHAENFCERVWLDKYGQTYDNCSAYPALHYNYSVVVRAFEHSACVSTTTNGWKSGLNMSWTCTPGPEAYAQAYANWSVLTYGIIRNNTTNDTNHASGNQVWCATQSCS